MTERKEMDFNLKRIANGEPFSIPTALNTLYDLQDAVDGPISIIRDLEWNGETCDVICNKIALNLNLPINETIKKHLGIMLVGPVVILTGEDRIA
jgi:hypothetical protein